MQKRYALRAFNELILAHLINLLNRNHVCCLISVKFKISFGISILGIPRATADTVGQRENGPTTSDTESDTEKPFYSIYKV